MKEETMVKSIAILIILLITCFIIDITHIGSNEPLARLVLLMWIADRLNCLIRVEKITDEENDE